LSCAVCGTQITRADFLTHLRTHAES
jgi:hypothetical protein